MTEWVTVSFLRKLTGIEERTLQRWCESGELPAKKEKGRWLVNVRQMAEGTEWEEDWLQAHERS